MENGNKKNPHSCAMAVNELAFEAHKYCVDELHGKALEGINKGYLQSRLGIICRKRVTEPHAEPLEESKINSN